MASASRGDGSDLHSVLTHLCIIDTNKKVQYTLTLVFIYIQTLRQLECDTDTPTQLKYAYICEVQSVSRFFSSKILVGYPRVGLLIWDKGVRYSKGRKSCEWENFNT